MEKVLKFYVSNRVGTRLMGHYWIWFIYLLDSIALPVMNAWPMLDVLCSEQLAEYGVWHETVSTSIHATLAVQSRLFHLILQLSPVLGSVLPISRWNWLAIMRGDCYTILKLISIASQLISSFGLSPYLHKLPSYLLCYKKDENAFFCKAKLAVHRTVKNLGFF